MLINQGYVMEKHHDKEKDPMLMQQQKIKRPVEDGVVMYDCSPCLRRFGLHRLIPKESSKVWFVKDICGVICVILTWMLILYAEYVVMFIMLMPNVSFGYKWGNAILFNFLTFMAVASHSKAMLSDPGAVPKGNATKENIMKLGLKEGQVVFKCPKCISIKPDRAHHCSVCQRCIRKMDHHCPWVNNCVGETNQKYFVLFTLYICLISVHAVYLAIQHFILCIGKDWKGCSGVSAPATTIFLIFLVFEGLLFGIFTAIMFGSQLSAICSDETGIEQLKKEQGAWERKSYWFSIKSVFGHPFSWRWFSPFSTPNYVYFESREYCV